MVLVDSSTHRIRISSTAFVHPHSQNQSSVITKLVYGRCRLANRGQQFDLYRIGRLVKQFGNRPAEILVEDLRQWFGEQDWKDGTYNRYKTMLSLIYRIGMENGKVQSNPARLLKRKREDNGRARFLNQFTPAKTETDYLKNCRD